MRGILIRLAVRCLLCCVCCARAAAAQVDVKVTGSRGAPVKDALVIVQDLQGPEHELFRALTGDDGNISPHSLGSGFYRAIAVYPYSDWHTCVREFLVRNDPVTLELPMSQEQPPIDVPVSVGRLALRVVDADNRPAAGARVLVRDEEADPGSEHWGTTDAQGNASLDLTMNPAVLVVLYRDRLYTYPTDGFSRERTLRLR